MGFLGSFSSSYTVFLFDWDHTIADSTKRYPLIYQHLNEVVERDYGIKPIIPFTQKGSMPTDRYLAAAYPEHLAQVEKIRDDLLKGTDILPELLPDAFELLQYLNQQGIPYAFVSDTFQDVLEPNVSATLLQAGLAPAAAIVGQSAEIPPKPHPDGILQAIKILEDQGYDCSNPLFVGDNPGKDGAAARSADIPVIIVPSPKASDIYAYPNLPSLHAVLKMATAGAPPNTIKVAPYVQRKPYEGVPKEQTEIITSDCFSIESPTASAVDLDLFSRYARALHERRWIAKRGRDLSEAGELCSPEEQIAAANDVINGFTTSDKITIAGLLTESMVERVAAKVKSRIDKWAPAEREITVHIPVAGFASTPTVREILRANSRAPYYPIPERRLLENHLTIQFGHNLAKRLTSYFQNNYTGTNVSFTNTTRAIMGITLESAIDEAEERRNISTYSLTEHDLSRTLQSNRTYSDLLGRLLEQPLCDYSLFKPGDLVILADDCAHTLGSLITWHNALTTRGVDVLAITTLSSLPESTNLQAAPHLVKEGIPKALAFAAENYVKKFPHADREQQLTEYERSLTGMLNTTGLSLDTLGNREVLTLMAYFIDGAQPEQVNWFYNMAQDANVDPDIIERKGESLKEQSLMPSINPNQLAIIASSRMPKYVVSYDRVIPESEQPQHYVVPPQSFAPTEKVAYIPR